MKNGKKIRDSREARTMGATIQAANALNEPVDLPRPALDSAKGNEVGGGGEAANPVIKNADKRIRSHIALG